MEAAWAEGRLQKPGILDHILHLAPHSKLVHLSELLKLGKTQDGKWLPSLRHPLFSLPGSHHQSIPESFPSEAQMWPENQHCAPSNHSLPPLISEPVRLSIIPGLTISKMLINYDTFISLCWPSLIHLLNAHIWHLTISHNIISIIRKNSW